VALPLIQQHLAADMAAIDEYLRECPSAIGPLDHLGTYCRVVGSVVFDIARALRIEQALGCRTVAAELPSIDDDFRHCATISGFAQPQNPAALLQMSYIAGGHHCKGQYVNASGTFPFEHPGACADRCAGRVHVIDEK